ncbi:MULTISPECIES: NADPH cytochrome P450 oxidoreductase family protein [Asticcacaulis]|uniref:NADPH cytochrome P450 oxidoreductase family protein n=1 Tax=Asticcacaulis TaxID=76890 RepID=UPI001AE54087|nr:MULTISPECIES: NADPH cytochrome P450 oxidoreductase family protein [Asticcacaulis]MBP2159211.1 sulfite reductase (NADPH) flavoprotein alpha-component [Asticcacaulis solisilvae]MDR6800256.1 sulfite reductase (NADPH) flavoprotein alpha-component [Asticcacaulis sp. BE141]
MTELGAFVTQDTTRWLLAGVAALIVLIVTLLSFRKKPQVSAAATVEAMKESSAILVLYASQTGQAESLARRTAASLNAGGQAAIVLSLKEATPDLLQHAAQALCVVSTAGEGDAPDEAMRFEHTLMKKRVELGQLSFAILALGDRTHGHFCAFGHRLDAWLMECGARQMRGCVEVDDLDPKALAKWDGFLSSLGAGQAAEEEIVFDDWRLAAREVLNPDSKAQKLVRVDLQPVEGQAQRRVVWQAGDLVEIITPKGHRRDYSIASLPGEGHVRLLVRQKADGDGSKLLTETLQPGEILKLRLKVHANFHLPEGSGPVLLIGAGSGLAGLRAHLLTAMTAGRPCWMIYGERNPVTDGGACDELIAWQDKGQLARLDLAFSSVTDGQGRYVQDALVGRTKELKEWLADGGSVLVCGGLDMGRAVDAALRRHLGNDWAEDAIAAGRYRRDLY